MPVEIAQVEQGEGLSQWDLEGRGICMDNDELLGEHATQKKKKNRVFERTLLETSVLHGSRTESP